jgi:hypothetical protein
MDAATQKRHELATRAVEELLAAYLLRCLDALPAKRAKILETELAPLLRKILKLKGHWWEMVEKSLDLDASIKGKVTALYKAQPAGTEADVFVRKYAALVLASKRL